VARWLYRGVRFYQAELSSLTPRCPHTPSCSQYAAQALHRHGAGRGSWLAVRRLLRCRPGTAGGLDLVPKQARAMTFPSWKTTASATSMDDLARDFRHMVNAENRQARHGGPRARVRAVGDG
jgi:putative membrane protein insertion efficiency factor